MPQDIILGSGSVGLTLAADLNASVLQRTVDPNLSSNISREHPSLNIYFQKKQLVIPTLSWSDIQPYDRIWVCLHGKNISEYILNLKKHLGTILFCHNGLLEKDWITDNTYRVLIYFGVQKEKTPQGISILHHGGNLIQWGRISPKESSEVLSFPSSQFNWEFNDSIQKKEIIKFFVNLVLLIYIKNSNQPNSSILKIDPQRFYEKFHFFRKIFHSSSEFHLTENDSDVFVNALISTAQNTSDNINSLSLAWSQGHLDTPRFFILQLLKVSHKASFSEQEIFEFFLGEEFKLLF